MEMEMDINDIDMDEEVTDPTKIKILKQIKSLHGLQHRHPRGIFTAPFSCHVIESKIRDGTMLIMGHPIMKATVSPSLIPIKTFSESEKSNFKKIFEKSSRSGMHPMPDVSVDRFKVADINSSPVATLDDEVVLRRYENFKKFDFAVDHSDHLFSAYPSVYQQPNWLKRIKQDRKILEEHLPDTIFVRAYESRMDLLRAVIIGLEGTPYQDGLFVFDLLIPECYPNGPPLVRYHSCGINPVINNFADVDWSVFKMSGSKETLWGPSMNVLHLLVFIQHLILHSKPYYNKFIYAHYKNSVFGEWSALLYNENTIIKSLKTMVNTMYNPPKNFEDLVVGHFRKSVCDILMACEAYMEGLLVGCLVTDYSEPCSVKFKNDVASCIKPLIDAFKKIGANEAQEFHYLIEASKNIRPKESQGFHHLVNLKKAIHVTVNKKRKMLQDIKNCEFLPWNIFARRDGVVTKVLIKCPTWVEKGQPLYVYDVVRPENLVFLEVSAFEKIADANHIFSMKNLLVDPDDTETSRSLERPHREDVNKWYYNFKKFEFVSDHMNHFFSAHNCAMNQPPSDWANKIREEWRILEESLPDTILVRVYKSRMDLLRAVIIGREGTPYYGGLFFFDLCFPSNYPDSPPLVHYHSGGLDINPNLSKCGKVRLSLPKTSGGQETIWVSGTSTMLQLLTSIQTRILNAEPLFNDLKYAIMSGSNYGQILSLRYNENIIIKSLKTMVHIMNKPPQNFGEFIPGHFFKHAPDIRRMIFYKNKYSVMYKRDLILIFQSLMDALWKMGALKSQFQFPEGTKLSEVFRFLI
uniref:uncharacterized protein LOC122605091 n=1 Tax=Erigeron canadensis TaxID=72917 RepID=UPI001CB97148|nr:uncharacterized protein LOC122605091 [Erigeron canadensis]